VDHKGNAIDSRPQETVLWRVRIDSGTPPFPPTKPSHPNPSPLIEGLRKVEDKITNSDKKPHKLVPKTREVLKETLAEWDAKYKR